MITPDEIKAADVIITFASMAEMDAQTLAPHFGGNYKEIENAAKYLKDDGLIEIRNMGGWSEKYKCTAIGLDLQKSGKKYAEFLLDKNKRLAEHKEKESRDNEIKELQKEDLITKLNTINPSQLNFWKSQMERNKQATLIAIISAIFSFIAMLKSFGLV